MPNSEENEQGPPKDLWNQVARRCVSLLSCRKKITLLTDTGVEENLLIKPRVWENMNTGGHNITSLLRFLLNARCVAWLDRVCQLIERNKQPDLQGGVCRPLSERVPHHGSDFGLRLLSGFFFFFADVTAPQMSPCSLWKTEGTYLCFSTRTSSQHTTNGINDKVVLSSLFSHNFYSLVSLKTRCLCFRCKVNKSSHAVTRQTILRYAVHVLSWIMLAVKISYLS